GAPLFPYTTLFRSYPGAVVGTAVTLLALWPLRFAAHELIERVRPEEQRLVVEVYPGRPVAELLAAVEREHARVDSIQIAEEQDRRLVTLALDTPSERLVSALSDLDSGWEAAPACTRRGSAGTTLSAGSSLRSTAWPTGARGTSASSWR